MVKKEMVLHIYGKKEIVLHIYGKKKEGVAQLW